jgi:hypothetical protein
VGQTAAGEPGIVIELSQAIGTGHAGGDAQPKAGCGFRDNSPPCLAWKQVKFHPKYYTCIIGLHGGLNGDYLVRTFLFSFG